MARKKHLLEVLRAREQRESGAPAPAGESSSRALRGEPPLPAWLIPGVGGALVLVLLFWAGCALFGGSGSEEPQGEGVPANVSSGEEDGQTYAVLAVTYDASRVEQAKKEGRALRELGYDVQLAQLPGPSGSLQFQLFVGSAARAVDLEPMLQAIQTLSIEGQATPFAGASIQPLPSAP